MEDLKRTTAELVARLRELEKDLSGNSPRPDSDLRLEEVYSELQRRASNGDRAARVATDFGL